MVDIKSLYYPYKKPVAVQTLAGSDDLTRKILYYFLDLPDKSTGYEPIDNNIYPRCRLWKYLYYDNDFPLEELLPTKEQKLNCLYRGNNIGEGIEAEKGYRLFAQPLIEQAQQNSETVMRIFTGTKTPIDVFTSIVTIHFQLLTSMKYEFMPSQAKARTEAMEQCIVEALNGLDIDGLGVGFTRERNREDGSYNIGDRAHNIGRQVNMHITLVKGIGGGTI